MSYPETEAPASIRRTGRMNDARRGLLMRQCAELQAIGEGITSISRKLGVAPSTIHRWRENDEYCAIRDELQKSVVSQTGGLLTSLIPKAFQCVKDAIEEGDSKVAMQLLDKCGALSTAGRIVGMDTSTGGSDGGTTIVVQLGFDDAPKTVDIDSESSSEGH